MLQHTGESTDMSGRNILKYTNSFICSFASNEHFCNQQHRCETWSWWLWLVPGIQPCHSLSEGCLLLNTSCSHGCGPLQRQKVFYFPHHLYVLAFKSNTNVWVVRPHDNTSVIQSIHHQKKLFEELHIVVWAVPNQKGQSSAKRVTVTLSFPDLTKSVSQCEKNLIY